ncbi:glycosyltransferase involved in cell wall biosynthesis [Georgenia soli]|uniref:Glycosyltransferase involved in cell wall biosynthesis n=1 Tax=Georgenia soli TaxID=638953 RepID=A0A2A9EJK0_9MICO|nr:glycosyltransferase [Georgenia soli]PFG38701.1 glycosyltransferase involved in cell wall biosynthesis [Georgenia soli]
MTAPDVDLVIAVHDPSRPVARAAASALAGDTDAVRVTIACHGIPAADVAASLPDDVRGRVRMLEVRDGLGSPSGPFNAGLDAATARYVAIMGSDDYVEPGALRAWADAADAARADVMLAPMRHQSGERIPTPRVRPGRHRRLDRVKDRLAYRTAPLGLMRREVLERHGLRLTPGMRSGGDVAFTVRLWSLPVRVDLAARAPRYVVGADAVSRVTTAVRPVTQELEAWEHLLAQDWFTKLDPAWRRAVAVKAVRIHLLGAVRRRPRAELWHAGEAAWLGELTRGWVGAAPLVARPQARADRDLIDVMLAPTTEEALAAASARRAVAGRWDQALTRELVANLERESVLRHYVGLRLRH